MARKSEGTPVFLVSMAARFLGRSEQERFVAILPQVITAAHGIDGFISVDFWSNALDPTLLLENSYWRNREAAAVWRNHPFHKKLQGLAYAKLIMENTTTWWKSEGPAHVYIKCPVCETPAHHDKDHNSVFGVAADARKCDTCGMMLPGLPSFTATDHPVWRTMRAGMDVIK